MLQFSIHYITVDYNWPMLYHKFWILLLKQSYTDWLWNNINSFKQYLQFDCWAHKFASEFPLSLHFELVFFL